MQDCERKIQGFIPCFYAKFTFRPAALIHVHRTGEAAAEEPYK